MPRSNVLLCYVHFKKGAYCYFTQHRERSNEGWVEGRLYNIKKKEWLYYSFNVLYCQLFSEQLLKQKNLKLTY